MSRMPHEQFDYKRIVVHGGDNFHTDDILCVSLAKLMNPDIEVVRETAADQINAYLDDPDTIVADIGRGYFDHHQADSIMSDVNGHKLCAAGIIYQTYKDQVPLDKNIRTTFECMLEQIDLQDNTGAKQELADLNDSFLVPWDKEALPADVMARFLKAADGLSRILGVTMQDRKPSEEEITLHRKLMDICPTSITSILFDVAYTMDPSSIQPYADAFFSYNEEYMKSTEKARQEIRDLCKKDTYRKGSSLANKILVMEDRFVPFDYLRETGYLFVVYPSSRGGWNLQTVPGAVEGSSRLPIEDLSGRGDLGCTFWHLSGFLAAFNSKQSAIRVAEREILQMQRANGEPIFDNILRRYYGNASPRAEADITRVKDAIELATIEYATQWMNIKNDPIFDGMFDDVTPDSLFADIMDSWSLAAIEPRLEEEGRVIGDSSTIVANIFCDIGLVGDFQQYATTPGIVVGEVFPREYRLNTNEYISNTEYYDEEARNKMILDDFENRMAEASVEEIDDMWT